MEICQECNKELKEIILFPHLIKENFFKQDINISTIPSEILKDLPKSHLHVYYLCTCGHKTYRDEIELFSDKEAKDLRQLGQEVSKKRTVNYWAKRIKDTKK